MGRKLAYFTLTGGRGLWSSSQEVRGIYFSLLCELRAWEAYTRNIVLFRLIFNAVSLTTINLRVPAGVQCRGIWSGFIKLNGLSLHYYLLGRHFRGQSSQSWPSRSSSSVHHLMSYYCIPTAGSLECQSHSFHLYYCSHILMVCGHGELLKWNETNVLATNKRLNQAINKKWDEEGKHVCMRYIPP